MTKLDDSIINNKYAANFNPARFALIKQLCERVKSPAHSGNKTLIEKAQLSIEQYQADIDQGKEKSNGLLKSIAQKFPDNLQSAQQLFAEYKFKQLQRLYDKLNKQTNSTESLLTQLNNEMRANSKSEPQVDLTQTLDQMLLQQEQQARRQSGAPQLISTQSHTDEYELQSLKTIRESMKYFNIDATIDRAIEHFPENAGPHNPHMLAITSLMKMRDLSPQYLRRFTCYIETVLWLEKNEVKLNRKRSS